MFRISCRKLMQDITVFDYKLRSHCSGVTYACIAIPEEDPTDVTTTLSCMMKFIVKDCDPNTGETDEEGYNDEYVVMCCRSLESTSDVAVTTGECFNKCENVIRFICCAARGRRRDSR